MVQIYNYLKCEDGQGMVEYGLILGLVALAVITALSLFGPLVANLYKLNEHLQNTTWGK